MPHYAVANIVDTVVRILLAKRVPPPPPLAPDPSPISLRCNAHRAELVVIVLCASRVLLCGAAGTLARSGVFACVLGMGP